MFLVYAKQSSSAAHLDIYAAQTGECFLPYQWHTPQSHHTEDLELRKAAAVLDSSSCASLSAVNSHLLFPGRDFYVEHSHQSRRQ